MTDVEKLRRAKDLLEDVYAKYGNLLKDNYSICSHLSCADGCINDAIEYLRKFREEIGNA